ncbi:MAG TPA: SET domain-containing protein-lysine N-methyltransferase [Steroidobacteraceae bacterium]|nr:SET domain-containing protein-lysine N-methyltransferase [Steroidobacteraceae bacterium]
MADGRHEGIDLLEVRSSSVHGLGAFAVRRIEKGTRIIEYVGERVSHEEADRRYEYKDANDSHTFLFIVDEATVIDAGVHGNEARFLNHSCEPNCESVIEGGRVFIEALVPIASGTELTYDYQIQREDDDPDDVDEVFACRCGFPACRGTMLWPPKRKLGSAPGRNKRSRAAHSEAMPGNAPHGNGLQPQATRREAEQSDRSFSRRARRRP